MKTDFYEIYKYSLSDTIILFYKISQKTAGTYAPAVKISLKLCVMYNKRGSLMYISYDCWGQILYFLIAFDFIRLVSCRTYILSSFVCNFRHDESALHVEKVL